VQTCLLVNVIGVPCYEQKSILLLLFERLYRTLLLPMSFIFVYHRCRSFSIGHVCVVSAGFRAKAVEVKFKPEKKATEP
jgi:hypothetical protein